MNKKDPRPPIIIIGMHRSGTAMLSRMLEDLGLFMGYKKQHDHEALFFLKINDWLLSQCGGSWEYPEAFHYLLRYKEVRALALTYIRYIIKTPRIISYLGLKRYLKYHSLYDLDFPWGWKDPRNTFTLPLWLDIFPDAKVIHIYRNGVDVANSLKVREDTIFRKRSQPIHNRYKRMLYILRPKLGGFTNFLRCASLEGGFSLWEEYLTEAQTHVESLKDRAISIKYEDFLAEPHRILSSLACFCGLSVSDDVIIKAAGKAVKSRAYAYKDNPELRIFCEQVASRMHKYGY